MKKLLFLTAFITCYIISNPLHDAARHGDLATVKKLIEEDNYNPNEQDFLGRTALHMAAHGGHKDVVVYLIEQTKYTIDPNLKGHFNNTALHLAAAHGHKDVVAYLIEQSKYPIDPNLQNIIGHTVLHLAAANGYKDVVAFLIGQSKYIFDPNVLNIIFHTVLHVAVEWGHGEVVTYLLEQSKYYIDLNLKDNQGKTALHNAAKFKCLPITKTLLYHGATIAICDNNGNYPFDYAKDPEMKKLLTPSNPEEFRNNPEEYKKKHPREFDPVARFPEVFKDLDKRALEKRLNNQNATNTVAYLLHRSIGVTNIHGKLVSSLMNPYSTYQPNVQSTNPETTTKKRPLETTIEDGESRDAKRPKLEDQA